MFNGFNCVRMEHEIVLKIKNHPTVRNRKKIDSYETLSPR